MAISRVHEDIWASELFPQLIKRSEIRTTYIVRLSPLKETSQPPQFTLVPARMDPDPCLHARRILGGTAEVEDGSIRGARVGVCGKESAVSVVEILDEVRGVIPVSD